MVLGVHPVDLGVRQHSPAAERNKNPILGVLERVLPPQGLVLEIASGSGQHISHFARALPELDWQPSDYDQVAVASIEGYARDARLKNLRQPLLLEVRSATWGQGVVDGVLCVNLLHVSGWAAAEGLFAGAQRHLREHGALVVYGPFKQRGAFMSPGDEEFDVRLRAGNPDHGIRDLESVVELGSGRGLLCEQVIDMPANNLCLVFRMGAGTAPV